MATVTITIVDVPDEPGRIEITKAFAPEIPEGAKENQCTAAQVFGVRLLHMLMNLENAEVDDE